MSLANQFSAALNSTTAEAILTLANLKFDFSLIKFEAPAEFHGVGQAISAKRRNAAEDGEIHKIARKLWALFENVIPETPALVRAYGTRASQIMESQVANPKRTEQYGFLQEHIGADATSLWAAATSGKGAIPMHLLACMLANVWNDLQATAIWEELVSRRNEQLAKSEQPVLFSRIDVNRDQLRDWDASARSWLQCANKFLPKQHAQLTIVSNSSGLSVDNGTNLYEDVISAWTSALQTTERLLLGESHEVMQGAILLALKSWHLYPDMLYLKETREFKQDDGLFPIGTRITVGVTSASPDRVGLSWSLPLAYLRYYGDPVLVTRSTAENASYVDVGAFCQIVLGSAIGHWRKTYDDFDVGVDLLVALSQSLEHDPEDGLAPHPVRDAGWFQLLAHAAKAHKNVCSFKKPDYDRYVALGSRKGKKFLAPREAHPPPFFGFNHFVPLFKAFEHEEWRIDLLRRMAKDIAGLGDHDELIIRYKSSALSEIHEKPMWEYASVLPTHTWTPLGADTSTLRFKRWTLLSLDLKRHPCRCLGRCVKDCPCARDGFCGPNCHPQACLQKGDLINCGIRGMPTSNPKNRSRYWKIAQHAMQLGQREDCAEIDYSTAFRHIDDDHFEWTTYAYEMKATVPWGHRHANLTSYVNLANDEEKKETWSLVYGDAETAAVFRWRGSKPLAANVVNKPDLSCVVSCIKSNTQSVGSLNRYLWESVALESSHGVPSQRSDARLPRSALTGDHKQYYSSLSYLAAAVDLYSQFPAAQVSLEILSRQLDLSRWHSSQHPNRNPKTNPFTLAEAFACITLLETGTVELPASSFGTVFALARDNSLYVAKTLLQDPWTVGNASAIEHLNGNVGKPGLTLLIPPPNPKMKKLDMTGYSVLNHARFDGNVHDSLAHTTLHLSFTKYEQPVSGSTYGEKDVRAYFRESLVSVLHRGEWIADLDVRAAREDPLFIRVPVCRHGPNHWRTNAQYDEKETPAKGLTAIDDWAELLDPPSIDGIVRTHGNWIGRLAATTLSVQTKKRTLVLPRDFCWMCVYTSLTEVDKVPDLTYMTDSDLSDGGASDRKGKQPLGSKKRKRASQIKKGSKSAKVKESRHGAILVA